ncbi:MAG: hypothetical protein OEY89_01700, partial [Gammaproteobacteria bacterium]|nr:hypothetical protein [Gammaproteobacteria bacterium]
IRMVLTLDLVKQTSQPDKCSNEISNNSMQNKWNYWAEKIIVRYQSVLDKSDTFACQEYSFKKLNSPDLIQWFFPVLLYLAFMLSGYEYNI